MSSNGHGGRRYMEMTFSQLAAVLFPHDVNYRRLTSDAPLDLRIVAVHAPTDQQGICRVVVESASFEALPEGMLLPKWTPRIVRHTP